MGKISQAVHDPQDVDRQIQRWYASEKGRETIRRDLSVAREACLALEQSLEIAPHKLEEPVTF